MWQVDLKKSSAGKNQRNVPFAPPFSHADTNGFEDLVRRKACEQIQKIKKRRGRMKRSVYGTVGKVTNFPTAPVDKIFVGIWTSVRVRFWWELSSICSKFEQASRANRRARFSRWAYADEILSTFCPLHLTDAFGHENVRRVREGFYYLFEFRFACVNNVWEIVGRLPLQQQ